MWSDNPASVYFVTAVGAFLGRTCNAAAGFGAGILVVCVWVIFECAGVYPGTLQQAIVCSSVSSAVMVPMMLYVTQACSTADLRLVVAILSATSMSAPIGAAILLRLDRHQVQIMMGCAVLGFVVMEQAAAWFRSLSSSTDSAASQPMWAPLQQLCGFELTRRKSAALLDVHHGPMSKDPAAVHLKADEGSSAGHRVVVMPESEPAQMATSALADPLHQRLLGAQAAAAAAVKSSSSSSSSSSNNSSSNSSSSAAAEISASSTDESRGIPSILHLIKPKSTSGTSSSSSWNVSSFLDLFSCCRNRKANSSSHSALKVVAYGAIAASVSGMMSALTGVGGPPLMIMYRALDTPKDTVRGTNAFIEMFAVRLITYYYMGLLKHADAQLYLVACSASTVGVLVGNQISGKLNQQAFRRVLLVLMLGCSGLMFVSGLGLLKDT